MLLIVFVALLCVLGRYTHWQLAAIVGLTVLCGGIAGWIVARTRLGFVQGIVFAVQFVLLVGLFLLLPLGFLGAEWPRWLLCAVSAAVAVGAGVVGGLTVRSWAPK